MNKETFKAGDEVYCPLLSKTIHKLAVFSTSSSKTLLQHKHLTLSFYHNGKINQADDLPSIFHAKPEKQKQLEALYKCDFESPKLKGSDLTRKLLSEGKHVLCYVNCHDDISAIKEHVIRIIDSIDGGIFRNKGGSGWKYAVPCNDYANLVDGVLIKSEQ